MTTQRSFKRLVRSRMEKTGESYTAARAQLLAATSRSAPRSLTSDETIRERTGRGWEEWFDLLDEWGAAERTHREIARWLAEQQGVHPLAWNVQAIVEQLRAHPRGRPVGEHEDGFTVTAYEDRRRAGRAALRRVRRRVAAGALAARRRAARAHRDEAALGPLRLGRRRTPRPRRLRRQGRRRRAPPRCRTSGSPTPRRRSA